MLQAQTRTGEEKLKRKLWDVFSTRDYNTLYTSLYKVGHVPEAMGTRSAMRCHCGYQSIRHIVELSTCACMKSFETVRRPSKVLTSV
jgi:hypothetical protein